MARWVKQSPDTDSLASSRCFEFEQLLFPRATPASFGFLLRRGGRGM
jgi:hypothetical protein